MVELTVAALKPDGHWLMMRIVLMATITLGLMGQIHAADKNDRDESIFFCSADPDLYDLLARAGQLDLEKQHDKSLELQANLLEIRPNCYDLHLSIGMTYAVTGNDEKSRYHYRRFEELKRQYQNSKPLQPAITQAMPAATKVITVAPPKKEKINYWKWLYIYSVLKKK